MYNHLREQFNQLSLVVEVTWFYRIVYVGAKKAFFFFYPSGSIQLLHFAHSGKGHSLEEVGILC